VHSATSSVATTAAPDRHPDGTVVVVADPAAGVPDLVGTVVTVAPGTVVVVGGVVVGVVVVVEDRGVVVVVVVERGVVVVVEAGIVVVGTVVGAGAPPPPSECPRDWPDTAWMSRTTPTASAATSTVAASRTPQRMPNTDPSPRRGRCVGPAAARPTAIWLLGAAGRPLVAAPATGNRARSPEEYRASGRTVSPGVAGIVGWVRAATGVAAAFPLLGPVPVAVVSADDWTAPVGPPSGLPAPAAVPAAPHARVPTPGIRHCWLDATAFTLE